MIETGIILFTIWGFFFLYCKHRKEIRTSKIMFCILFCMALPNILDCKFLYYFYDITINYADTILFSILIISSMIPWIKFDRYLSQINKCSLCCSTSNIKTIKLICNFLIISSVYCIAYLLPYAYIGLMTDANVIRANLSQGESLLPSNIFTTICVGLSAFNIYCILFFYISFCFKELKKYRIPLFISSFSNVIAAATFAGRDQFVVIIIFFCVFYLALKPYFLKNIIPQIKRVAILTLMLAGGIILIFSISRFYNKGERNIDYFLAGTVGYIAEQPLVFNSYIEKENTYIGINNAFPLINSVLQLPSRNRIDTKPYTWQFGTMYAAFYSMFGWYSLIIISFIYWSYYTFGIKYLIRSNQFFNVLLFFCVYLYLEVTGIFYLKAAGTILINLFYVVLSIGPLFMKNLIVLKKNKSFPKYN